MKNYKLLGAGIALTIAAGIFFLQQEFAVTIVLAFLAVGFLIASGSKND